MKVLTNKEKIEMDKYTIEQLKIPSIILMEEAAHAIFRTLKQRIKKKDSILVLIGMGNNGGDGFALSRLLHINSYDVNICKLYEPKSKDAKRNSKLCNKYSIKNIDYHDLNVDNYNIIVDAVFGSGFKGSLEDHIQKLFKKINLSNCLKVSVDIPSGVSGNNKDISLNCFNADFTVTFEYPIIAHCLYPGKKFTGKLIVQPIGLKHNQEFEKEIIEQKDIKLDSLKYDVHKYSRGQVSVIDGIEEYSGASYLAAKSALKIGAGYVKLLTNGKNRFLDKTPEIVLDNFKSYENIELDEKVKENVLVVGPGLGRDKDKLKMMNNLFNSYEKLDIIIDADGLFYFNEFYNKNKHRVIITPHLGEFSRIIDKPIEKIRKNIIQIGAEFAINNNLTLVLKSETTIIFSEEGKVAINNYGNPYMATLGAGDVLTGIIAGLWATQQGSKYQISKKGVGIHSLVGDYLYENKVFNFTSSDIIDNIKNVLVNKIDTRGGFKNDC